MARRHHFVDPGRQSFPAKKTKRPGFEEADLQKARALSRAKAARKKAAPKKPSRGSVVAGSRGAISPRTKRAIRRGEREE